MLDLVQTAACSVRKQDEDEKEKKKKKEIKMSRINLNQSDCFMLIKLMTEGVQTEELCS